ncbi:hypothetical protein ACFZAV_42830 [Streptomyces sp. NPDC008343]|uniref:hypothetical protein n=1 Tax=Streptomyces sp. NPDC008343 TaxID=3364828 RepID=UPI0036E66389
MTRSRTVVTDAHTGWTCIAGASLITEANSPGAGHLPRMHAVIYACEDHRDDAEARMTAAGFTAATHPAPPSHRWDPWPCGHITAYDVDTPAESFAAPAPINAETEARA